MRSLLSASKAHPLEMGGAISVRMAKPKKIKNKLKINLTLR